MEQVTSLINKLELQIRQGVTVEELLLTTGQLKSEWHMHGCNDLIQKDSVAVWYPAGYKTPTVLKAHSQVAKAATFVTETQPISSQEGINAKVEASLFVPLPPKAPVPPVIITSTAPVFEQKVYEEKYFAGSSIVFNPDVTVDENQKKPVFSEAPELIKKATEPRPFPQYPDAASIMQKAFPEAPVQKEVIREVNEMVAEPVTALNQRLHEKKVELAEVLVTGTRVTDIRKAISINEKYQMINMLFRGDEDSFERSIRTLNNFGSLPEARFWMQRELILKLGWNEEDDLVQHFQRLISRRFS